MKGWIHLQMLLRIPLHRTHRAGYRNAVNAHKKQKFSWEIVTEHSHVDSTILLVG
jgi:hypothetical protein